MPQDIYSAKGTGNTKFNHGTVVCNIPGTGSTFERSFISTSPLLADIQEKYLNRFDDVAVLSVTSGTTGDLSGGDSGGIYNNDGAAALTEFTLPTAEKGLNYSFMVTNANGIKIHVNNTSDRIYVGTSSGILGGYVESSGVGSIIKLIGADDVNWYGTEMEGSWFLSGE